jgi:hypothetical protein
MSIKHLGTLALIACSTLAHGASECYLRSTAQANAASEIQRIVDTRSWVTPYFNDVESGKQCSVTFKAQIAGRWYSGLGKHSWTDSVITDTVGCNLALELGKQSLVHDTATTKLKTEQTLICSDEPSTAIRSVKEGDIIKESMVSPNPARPLPFTYNNTICKWFTELDIADTSMYQWQGIICEVRPGLWRVINKF